MNYANPFPIICKGLHINSEPSDDLNIFSLRTIKDKVALIEESEIANLMVKVGGRKDIKAGLN